MQRLHLFDGSRLAGKPTGPYLTIVEVRPAVFDLCGFPIGAREPTVVLSDGGWEFAWNLCKEEAP